jgi:hypothetical protein
MIEFALEPHLLNPDGKLPASIRSRMFFARKNKPLWAKEVEQSTEIASLEGHQIANAGDYLCRGIKGELWPQSKKKLLQTYLATQSFDDEGWQRFDPKPDGPVVRAAKVEEPFLVNTRWGIMTGKKSDYVVQSTVNPDDVWIVDGGIFEASYERVGTET